MKYLKRFATETAYNEYINSGSTVYLPNVSLIDNGTVSKFNDSKWNQLVNGAQAEQQVSTFTYYQAGVTFPVGTKVFLSCDCKVTSDFSATSSPRLILSDNGSMYGGALNTMTGIAKDNQWHHYSGVVSSADARNHTICLYMYKLTAGSCWFRNVMAINLTALYGRGNEPTAAQFIAQYPDVYYPYKPL